MSEFALQLHKRLVDERKVSETTASAYIKTLGILNDKKPIKNLMFLKKYDTIDAMIDKYADNTKKTIYASIASILLLFKDTPAYKKCYSHYLDKMKLYADESKKIDTTAKTDKQQKNWIEWDDVKKVHKELYDKVLDNDETDLGEKAYNDLLGLVVLSLYTDIPPRRNQDYLLMKVVSIKEEQTLPTDSNYLIIDKKVPSKFIFNVYKTAKTYGSQSIPIPENLAKVLTLYFKHHPTIKSIRTNAKVFPPSPFLVSFTGSTITADNFITRTLNKIFDKSIGCSMLRHIYLSGKQDVNEMINDANSMAHSLSQQREYLKASSPPPSPAPPSTDPPTPIEPPSALPQSPPQTQ